MTVTMRHGRVVRRGSDCDVPTYPDDGDLVPDLLAAVRTATQLADLHNHLAVSALWHGQVSMPQWNAARAQEEALAGRAALMEARQLVREAFAAKNEAIR